MEKIEEHKYWWWGENRQWYPGEETLIRLQFPRCFIRYKLGDAYFASFDDFYNRIAEVQWLDGKRPSKKEQEEILIEAWNFLAIEEYILEDDMANFEIDVPPSFLKIVRESTCVDSHLYQLGLLFAMRKYFGGCTMI